MDICGGIQLLNYRHLSVVLDTEGFHVWSPDAKMSQISHKSGFMSASPKRITQMQAYSCIKPPVKFLQRKGSRSRRGGMSCPWAGYPLAVELSAGALVLVLLHVVASHPGQCYSSGICLLMAIW